MSKLQHSDLFSWFVCYANPEIVISCSGLLNSLSSSGKNTVGKMAICLNNDGVGNPKCWNAGFLKKYFFVCCVHKLLITFPH